MYKEEFSRVSVRAHCDARFQKEENNDQVIRSK